MVQWIEQGDALGFGGLTYVRQPPATKRSFPEDDHSQTLSLGTRAKMINKK
jgi:hypothetical protein